jgi:hypothetical protein
MSGQIGLVLDGVLRRINDSQAVDQNGLLLFEGLKNLGRITFLADGFNRDRTVIEHFLRFHRISDYVDIDITVLSDGPDTVSRRLTQIKRLRRTGPITFVVEPDPKIAAALMADGVSTLLYLHPQFTVPSWRPDYIGGVRRWDDLVAETERQEDLRADEDLREKETL